MKIVKKSWNECPFDLINDQSNLWNTRTLLLRNTKHGRYQNDAFVIATRFEL